MVGVAAQTARIKSRAPDGWFTFTSVCGGSSRRLLKTDKLANSLYASAQQPPPPKSPHSPIVLQWDTTAVTQLHGPDGICWMKRPHMH